MSIHVNETGVTKTVSDNTLFVELIYNKLHTINATTYDSGPITSLKYHIQEFDLLFVTLHSIQEGSDLNPRIFNFFTSYNMLKECGQLINNIFILTSPVIQGYKCIYTLYSYYYSDFQSITMSFGIPVPTAQSSYRDKIYISLSKRGSSDVLAATKMRIYIYGIKFGSEIQGLIAA